MDVDNGSAEAVLLLTTSTKEITPASTAAFRITQSHGAEELNRKLVGAIVVFRNGRVVTISRISVLGRRGSSLWEKAIGFLSGAKAIRVSAKPAQVDFEVVRSMIIEYLIRDQTVGKQYFKLIQPLDDVVSAIRQADTMEQIFAAISVSPLEDCLDVL